MKHRPRTMGVVPIHGWGWVIAGSARVQVPEPFTIQVEHAEAQLWSGVVLDRGHEFEGQRASLSPRHADWTGYVNMLSSQSDRAGKP